MKNLKTHYNINEKMSMLFGEEIWIDFSKIKADISESVMLDHSNIKIY